MDYLDPQKKRSHKVRLYIGYSLIAVAISIATVILVYIGSGFYLDKQTGSLIQNGQLFVNSNPEGATIYLNGEQQRTKTVGRLVVPSGSYKVTLKRDGFREWSQQVLLEGGRIQRLDYARLLPTLLTPKIIQTFATVPQHISQSFDRRFLTFTFAEKPLSIFVYDLTKPDVTPVEIIIAANTISNPVKTGQLNILEWSEDNKHFLVSYSAGGILSDYLIASRDVKEPVTNLTVLLGIKTSVISFRNHSFDHYYVYNPADKSLGTVSIEVTTVIPRLNNVLAYKTFDNDQILYVSATSIIKNKVQARLSINDKSYLLRELTPSDSYLLDIAKLSSSVVIAVGSSSENKVTILRNPVEYLHTHPEQTVPSAVTILQVPAPTEVSFSTDASVVMARGGQKFAVHYFEEDKSSTYELGVPVPSDKLRWIDGKHLQAMSGADAYLFDYDGANLQKTVPSLAQFGSYFDNNYQNIYGFTTFTNGIPFTVTRSSLKVTGN